VGVIVMDLAPAGKASTGLRLLLIGGIVTLGWAIAAIVLGATSASAAESPLPPSPAHQSTALGNAPAALSAPARVPPALNAVATPMTAQAASIAHSIAAATPAATHAVVTVVTGVAPTLVSAVPADAPLVTALLIDARSVTDVAAAATPFATLPPTGPSITTTVTGTSATVQATTLNPTPPTSAASPSTAPLAAPSNQPQPVPPTSPWFPGETSPGPSALGASSAGAGSGGGAGVGACAVLDSAWGLRLASGINGRADDALPSSPHLGFDTAPD
jgi:hypothetical protein